MIVITKYIMSVAPMSVENKTDFTRLLQSEDDLINLAMGLSICLVGETNNYKLLFIIFVPTQVRLFNEFQVYNPQDNFVQF